MWDMKKKMIVNKIKNLFYNKKKLKLISIIAIIGVISVVLVFKGNVAADDEVENPNNATLPILFTNLIGLSLAPIAINIEYPKTKNNNNAIIVVNTYTNAGFKLSTPYIANVLVIRTNIDIAPNLVIIKLKNTVIIEFISSNKVFNTVTLSPK